MEMNPTHISIYNVKTTFLKVLLAIAIILGIIGIGGIFDYLFLNQSWQITNHPYVSMFLILQSASSIFIVYQGFRNTKYFVAWNENKINFFLPNCKQMETIPLNEIESVKFENHLIKIRLKNSDEKAFNLNYLYFPQRSQVKEYFQAIKNQTENKSQ